ncbi:stress-response A/B barrel domain-containing protein UP3-like [Salvia miltiorrhiza]|uniref:stress-response A/B barrel domain-containing protein UP3-like n=1 Tax=Salvia miltiorrhiza TaxID=226208 RepID=UPI0025AB88C1|nr:stress-response A/B barrel domain-containing protein UP3-like [Salvia miltiorrhiza]
MLCVRAAARTNAFALHSPPPPLRRNLRSPFSVRMSSSAPNQIIEHVVLLKAKPSADPSAVNDMVRNLNGLATLDSVLHISAGPVTRCRSASLTFTHLLHARYRSKSDLASYTVDPTHVNVVVNYVKPVVDDVIAVDWVAEDFSGPVVVPPGAALRLTVMKLKEEAGESGKSEVLGIVRGIQEKFDSIKQLTAGENFSPERSNGFSIASVAVVKGAEELEALAAESELVNEQKNKAREFLDGVIVLDFTVPAPVPAAAPSL